MASGAFEQAVSVVRTNPLATGLITTAAISIAWTVKDFSDWKSFGTGGTPPTWAGYWRMTKLRVKALLANDDLLDTSVYDRSSGPLHLTELPTRGVPRPKLMPRILPQRQVPDRVLSTASRARLHDMVTVLAAEHPDLLEVKPSHTEGKTTDGLYAKRDVSSLNPVARDKILDHEIGHAHPSDDSLHVWLSDRDAIEVVEKGWGQRFCLPFVNRGWVMVYAPRNMEEVEVVESILKAAVQYLTGVKV
ncbi:hypothetical protein PFICI_07035 [Pestalotiopsis fici W106-1]|uniref:Luciferase domain-containing protein n=1 Tax=Pestalotiopsis fici (strain W106-1 / CGMCC3.15140) TaxID=1229662 RepID=W3X7D9_PESFW|nr:uncharacterized protein PFICI_07035 [Pestalotiopsis fici W106-1]ETS82033.1 hypothetical protein PFICI_07035 [Pestalotiopsis fici W106-1]